MCVLSGILILSAVEAPQTIVCGVSAAKNLLLAFAQPPPPAAKVDAVSLRKNGAKARLP
jgi:hypothetical protein